jgi:hypothetical protein
VQTGQNSSQGQADERMMQLLRLLNRPLERSPESRRRNLAWYTPIIVPVWPQVRAWALPAARLTSFGLHRSMLANPGKAPWLQNVMRSCAGCLVGRTIWRARTKFGGQMEPDTVLLAWLGLLIVHAGSSVRGTPQHLQLQRGVRDQLRALWARA